MHRPPSCTPSRGSILTGQHFWRLGSTANLWSVLPEHLPVYPELLAAEAGYFTGHTRKGWGPGRTAGRDVQPAGPRFANFEEFLDQRPDGQPFCFWFGSHDPHQLHNVAEDPAYAGVRRELADRLAQALRETGDPRELGVGETMDEGEYFGGIPGWPGQEVIDRYREE